MTARYQPIPLDCSIGYQVVRPTDGANVSAPAYREVMSEPVVVTMDALWPDMPEQRRPYEVVVTAPREDGGEPLVPRSLPAVVLCCWSATLVTASVTVMAARP